MNSRIYGKLGIHVVNLESLGLILTLALAILRIFFPSLFTFMN